MASLSVFLSLLFIFPVTKVFAETRVSQNGDVTVAKTEVVNDDLFIGAQSAEIDGTVNGDVFVGGQTVKITGTINGNLHAGANAVYLGGTVKGNVYAGGQNIMVTGSKIGGSLLLGGATANIDKDSVIGGSILAGAGMLSIDSQVKRSVYAGTGSLTIGSDASIGKDLYYASGKNQGQVTISENAKIVGTVHKSEANKIPKNPKMAVPNGQFLAILGGISFAGTIISFLGALIVGFLYFKLFNKNFVQTANLVSKSFWKSFGVGFLVTIAFVPGLIILLITIVGIPVAGLSLLFMALYAYLAKIVVGSALGAWISQKFNWKLSAYLTFALGLLAIFLVKMVPFVGFLGGLVVFWVGLGALTLRTFSKHE